jgi:hypothetical protein
MRSIVALRGYFNEWYKRQDTRTCAQYYAIEQGVASNFGGNHSGRLDLINLLLPAFGNPLYINNLVLRQQQRLKNSGSRWPHNKNCSRGNRFPEACMYVKKCLEYPNIPFTCPVCTSHCSRFHCQNNATRSHVRNPQQIQ